MNQPANVKAEVVQPAAAKTTAMMTRPVQELAVARPVVTPAEAAKIMKEYDDLKKAIATEDDIRREKRKKKNRETGEEESVDVAYYKKSYWRKLATFLGIRVEVITESEKREVLGAVKLASVIYLAFEPNGRSVPGDGYCGTDEAGKSYWTWSNLIATAHTRAYNRAVSNLVGGGEVSAEELDVETLPAEGPKPQKNKQFAQPAEDPGLVPEAETPTTGAPVPAKAAPAQPVDAAKLKAELLLQITGKDAKGKHLCANLGTGRDIFKVMEANKAALGQDYVELAAALSKRCREAMDAILLTDTTQESLQYNWSVVNSALHIFLPEDVAALEITKDHLKAKLPSRKDLGRR